MVSRMFKNLHVYEMVVGIMLKGFRQGKAKKRFNSIQVYNLHHKLNSAVDRVDRQLN